MSAARAALVAAMLAGATGPAIAEVCAVATDGDDAKAALGAAPFATATAAVEARTADGGWRCDEVRLALTSDTTHSYSFYSDPRWCSRGIFNLGDVFSYHTWVGYRFDDETKLESAYGYHAVTIELPIIGFHDYEFPRRDIQIHR